MTCAVIPFPIERTRPAVTMSEMRKRRALAATATDTDADLNTRIRAAQRLLDRPNMRPADRTIWRDYADQLHHRALQTVRDAIGRRAARPD